MITFKQFLYEMLKPSEYRPLIKGWDKTRLEKVFKSSPLEKDRKAYRLFIPLSPDIVPPDIRKAIEREGYTFSTHDYLDGYAKKGNRKIKIGKILPDALKQKFANDPARQVKGSYDPNQDYTAIISRHPYDVAKMSTRQGWTSCQDLVSGKECRFVPKDIEAGTLVAYMIKTSDRDLTDPLKSPVGRTLIKPFINNKNETAYAREVKAYGKVNDKFMETIKDWVNWLNKQTGVKGIFVLQSDVYKDGFDTGSNIMLGDNSEVQRQIDMVNANPLNFIKIKNPSENIKLMAVSLEPELLEYIKNPSELLQVTAVTKKAFSIMYIDNPSEKIQLLAINNSAYAIRHIKNPTEMAQLAAVIQIASSIKYIKNPTEKVKRAANVKMFEGIK